MAVFTIVVVLVSLVGAFPSSHEAELDDEGYTDIYSDEAEFYDDDGYDMMMADGLGEFYYDHDQNYAAMVEPVEPSASGQIKGDDKLEYGLWYDLYSVTVLGYSVEAGNGKSCCEECKKLYKDTELFGLFSETGECDCYKSKPGVVPLTRMAGAMSGKCGLLEYHGEGELGEGRVFIEGSTQSIGYPINTLMFPPTDNDTDASYCCQVCMDFFPDTQLVELTQGRQNCNCYNLKNDSVPATKEVGYAIGTCLHGQALEIIMAHHNAYDYNAHYNAYEDDYSFGKDYGIQEWERLIATSKNVSTMDYLVGIEDYDYNSVPSGNYEPMTREFLVKTYMDSFETYFDINPKDGNLTKEEFEMVVQSGAAMNLTWEELLKIIDEDCDGAIIDLEFGGMANISFNRRSMDKDRDFYISQEELGDDELWKTLLDQHAEPDGRVNMDLENDRCSAPPSDDPLLASEESLDHLFDDDGGDLGDGLDKIVVTLYRVRAAGEKTYYKETADGEMELI